MREAEFSHKVAGREAEERGGCRRAVLSVLTSRMYDAVAADVVNVVANLAANTKRTVRARKSLFRTPTRIPFRSTQPVQPESTTSRAVQPDCPRGRGRSSDEGFLADLKRDVLAAGSPPALIRVIGLSAYRRLLSPAYWLPGREERGEWRRRSARVPDEPRRCSGSPPSQILLPEVTAMTSEQQSRRFITKTIPRNTTPLP